eukprot:g67366.t1
MPVQRPYCESRSLASATRSWSSSLALFSTNASARPLDPRLGGMGKLRTKVTREAERSLQTPFRELSRGCLISELLMVHYCTPTFHSILHSFIMFY